MLNFGCASLNEEDDAADVNILKEVIISLRRIDEFDSSMVMNFINLKNYFEATAKSLKWKQFCFINRRKIILFLTLF